MLTVNAMTPCHSDVLTGFAVVSKSNTMNPTKNQRNIMQFSSLLYRVLYESIYSFSDNYWKLVAQQTVCKGDDGIKMKEKYRDVRACADACRGLATMIQFERQDFCDSGLCECFCLTSASPGGTCNQQALNQGVGIVDLYSLGKYCFSAHISENLVLDGYFF